MLYVRFFRKHTDGNRWKTSQNYSDCLAEYAAATFSVILYTALFMNVLFKVVIQDFQFIMKYLRIYLFFTG